jgi:(E)-4-hydroxy-3-methylbut-2-enyl-diphosphate synthase
VESLSRESWAASSTAPASQNTPTIGISLPGTSETPAAPVFVDGKEFRTRGPNIATEFKAVMMDYIDQRDAAGDKVPASAVTAAEQA